MSGFLHLLGVMFGIAATILLLLYGHDTVWKVVSFSIYGASVIILYLCSTLYHWLPANDGGKHQVLRKLDHGSIYALIAGSYTPLCLVTLHGAWGWTLFGIIWGLALIGILVQSVYINVWRWLTTTVYVIMGWLIVVGVKPLLAALPLPGVCWLALGGIIYSIGGVIYTIKKPNLSKTFGFHELWHVFVLLGTICQFMAMFFYVARG